VIAWERGEEMSKAYEVSWTIKLTRWIEASNKAEAIEISEDMGNGGMEVDTYDITPMKAKRIK